MELICQTRLDIDRPYGMWYDLFWFAAAIHADVAELADAPDLGSGVYDVQVQVLSSAFIQRRRSRFWLRLLFYSI